MSAMPMTVANPSISEAIALRKELTDAEYSEQDT